MQALKIKELINAPTDHHKQKIIRQDGALLKSLASAASPNRHLGGMASISEDNLKILEKHRFNQLKYGRVMGGAKSVLQSDTSTKNIPLSSHLLARPKDSYATIDL